MSKTGGIRDAIVYKNEEKKFIREWYGKIPNTAILIQLNVMRDEKLSMSALRHQLRRMKLIKGVRLINWSLQQTQYLKENYHQIGNIELAEQLARVEGKRKYFTSKHVQKKLDLLNLQRTAEMLRSIIDGHKQAKHYPGRIAAPEGTVRTWILKGLPIPHIKVGKVYIKQARIVYEQHHGPIPKGMAVLYHDANTLNVRIENLYLVDRGRFTVEYMLKLRRIAKTNIDQMTAERKRAILPSVPKAIKKVEIRVNIKPGLSLYVKPGTDINALKQKYDQHYGSEIRSLSLKTNS